MSDTAPSVTSTYHHDLIAVCSGACILGLTSILYEVSGSSPSTGAFYRCVFAILPLALLAGLQRHRGGHSASRRVASGPDAGGPATSGPWVFKSVGAGVFLGIDLLLWHRSINEIGAGLATVLISLQVVFAAALGAIFLRQRVGIQLWRSIPVLLIGVVLVAGSVHTPSGGSAAGGAGLAVLAAAAYAAYIVLMGSATRNATTTAEPMLVSTLATAATAGLVGLLEGSLDLTPSLPTLAWLVLLALDAQVIGWVLVAKASRRLPAGSIAATLVLQSAAALIFAAVLLGQRPTLAQTLGAAIILGGVAMTVLVRRTVKPGTPHDRQPQPLESAAEPTVLVHT